MKYGDKHRNAISRRNINENNAANTTGSKCGDKHTINSRKKTAKVGDFPRWRDDLVSAAAAFSERVYDTGVAMLRARVQTTHRPFQEYLSGLDGASLKWSSRQSLPYLTDGSAYPILRNPGVTR